MADAYRLDPELRDSLSSPSSRSPSGPSNEGHSSGFSDSPVLLYPVSDPRLNSPPSANSTALRPGQFSNSHIPLYPASKNGSEVNPYLDFAIPEISPYPDIPSDTIYSVDGFAITESAVCTSCLFGSKFVPPHLVSVALDGHERRAVVFVFHVGDWLSANNSITESP
jgi:hypothetical protein